MAYKLLKKNQISTRDPRTIANLCLLADKPIPARGNKFMNHLFPGNARELWHEHKDLIMQSWPCEYTRPLCWWLFDAPAKPPFDLPLPGGWISAKNVPSEAIQRLYLERHGIIPC